MTKEQWDAIVHRDKGLDGTFYYGLRTTKKFCRPSCPKRSYDPRRIVVFGTAAEATEAGYRPCARCHPELSDWTNARTQLARSTDSYLRQHYAERFSLDAIADAMHVDKAYLARTFKSVYGSTLLERCNVVRCQHAREMLTRPELSISYIAAAVGYVSPSHFTQVFRKTEGLTPSEFRSRYFASLEEGNGEDF